MLSNYFTEQIRNHFPHQPTSEQTIALQKISDFLFSSDPEALFLLKGYAGTGKSSLIGAVVKTMAELKQKTVLMAPTGRAAKVFASYAGQNAFTIHKKIYRQKMFSNEMDSFLPSDNLHTHTLFIVDEASMISNEGIDSFSFGSGRLLDDLIHYVYAGEGCRLLLIGDSAQLPPVHLSQSPALDSKVLEGYNLRVNEFVLTQVIRQTEHSGILLNATRLRNALIREETTVYPQLSLKNEDVKEVPGEELIETLDEAYSRDGLEETIIITRSNKRANVYNNGIRNRILYREEALTSGDLLMVAKNNYFWGKEQKEIDFIANGDLMEVKRVRKIQELYGFTFADLTVYFPDYEIEMDIKMIMECLSSDTPTLLKEENDRLFYTVLEDYAEVTTRREKMKKMKADPFYNAVQAKYAYSVTCHKAQGGQWKNVFLDLSYIPEQYLSVDFYRWLYTAVTRVTHRLFLINPVKEIIENNGIIK